MARKAEGVGGREAQQLQQQQHLLSFQDDWSSSEAAPGACTFRAKQYFESLETSLLGRVLLTAGTVGSTQEVVQENVSRLPDGLVLVADKQAGGRGGMSQAAPACWPAWELPAADAGQLAKLVPHSHEPRRHSCCCFLDSHGPLETIRPI